MNHRTIVYNYQMELMNNATPSDVLPPLEIAVTNTLIKTLYGRCEKRALKHHSVTRITISTVELAGINSFPPDVDMTALLGKLTWNIMRSTINLQFKHFTVHGYIYH